MNLQLRSFHPAQSKETKDFFDCRTGKRYDKKINIQSNQFQIMTEIKCFLLIISLDCLSLTYYSKSPKYKEFEVLTHDLEHIKKSPSHQQRSFSFFKEISTGKKYKESFKVKKTVKRKLYFGLSFNQACRVVNYNGYINTFYTSIVLNSKFLQLKLTISSYQETKEKSWPGGDNIEEKKKSSHTH